MAKPEINEAIQAIYDRDGEVKASVVVTDACPVSSPLHDHFQWDDTLAAIEHRLGQARRLIRTVKIEYEGELTQLINVPVVHMEDGDEEGASEEGSYQVPAVIVQTQSEFDRALGQLIGQIKAIGVTVAVLEQATENKDDTKLLGQLSRAVTRVSKLTEHLAAP